jgi:hypothetical protein
MTIIQSFRYKSLTVMKARGSVIVGRHEEPDMKRLMLAFLMLPMAAAASPARPRESR